MHPPKDLNVTHHQSGRGAPPSGSVQDTAGWQALYSAMLSHITGNVEVWLSNYMAEVMAPTGASGQPPRAAATPGPHPSPTGSASIKFVIPPWLEPFQDPDKVRFTRTPDHILMQERDAWSQPTPTNDDNAGSLSAPTPEAAVPERKSYVLPPNVRNTRTPDRILARQATAAPEGDGEVPSTPDTESEDATVSVSEVPMEVLVADAFEVAIEADAAGDLVGDAEGGSTEEWPLVAPQPWGEVIQLGPIETPLPAPEQDNVWGPFASFLVEPFDQPVQPVAIGAEPELDETAPDAVEALDDDAVAELEPDAPAVVEPEELLSIAEIITVAEPAAPARVTPPAPALQPANALQMSFLGGMKAAAPARRPRGFGPYEHPPLDFLSEPVKSTGQVLTRDALEQNARLLEGVLEDFGIRGEIINVRPGPVVTLYELEPAPGIKSSRVVGLADDIARSMSAISARVAVVQGRNAIGIELPNQRRDTVYLRELLAQPDFEQSKHKLAIGLGKTIGGEPVIVDLARMPHLLVAGTTGSGKSVAINTMILSLLYRLKPEECRLIMVDPKMLELSVYDGIPHLLTPVVTDPKKAVVALKWAVREMEDRYKKMSKVGVRNIDGFNVRVADAKARGEVITRTVQTGYDRETGEAVFETEAMDLTVLPYIVVIVDEMADLMMVAGKDIEGAIQRLAQMARAAGIHLIMATQRPSVDVITGTIKANFPTRISFQVTSKIDSRTILGEQGAEQLLGQGDMLHMMGGGRISRVHGPFVSDEEVERVVAYLKTQGPARLPRRDFRGGRGRQRRWPGRGRRRGLGRVRQGWHRRRRGRDDLYDQAVKIVLRDKKCSTSYIQRRLSVGYNKAASLVERMEKEGIVGASNHAGKREILIYSRDVRAINIAMPDDDEDA